MGNGQVIKPVINMTPTIHSVSNLMVSRWGFEAAVLLFEDKLNLSLPCTNTFRFTKGLKSIDPKPYLDSLKNEGAVIPNIVKQYPNSMIAIIWVYDLSNIDDVKTGKIFDSPDYKKIFDNVSNIYRERDTRDTIEKEELSKKLKEINLSSILNSSLQKDILEKTNKSFYGEIGGYPNKVKSILDAGNLNEEDKLILADALMVDSRLRLFRFQHEQTTWFMLVVITISSLFLSWLFFSLQNKK